MSSRVVDWSLKFEPYWDRVPAALPLLEGIAHDPGDRSRRLILADLLEEHGEADRAEFIRLQLAEMSGPYFGWQNTHSLREKELIEANRERWLVGLPDVPGLDWGNPLHFIGGLLERLVLDGALFAQHVETLVGRFDLRNMHLTGAYAREVSLPASDLYARLCHLTVFSLNIGDAGLVRLLESLRHPNLLALNVGVCRLTPRGWLFWPPRRPWLAWKASTWATTRSATRADAPGWLAAPAPS
ncbi:MAG: TIGR02996 domain-containing protein [Gemmataceae bacterium]